MKSKKAITDKTKVKKKIPGLGEVAEKKAATKSKAAKAPAKAAKAPAKATAKKSTAKSKTPARARNAKVVEYVPNKEKFTKTGLVAYLMENDSAPSKKQVQGILEDLNALMTGSVHPKGVGEFMMPGLFKIVTKKIPARPRRFGVNPFTKEEQWFEAKPASVRVKIRPMKALKDAALA